MHSGSRRFGDFVGLLRRLAVLAALSAFLATTMGVPLPSGPVKDRSQPFACMDRACGCMNAAQCWKGCCCFSDREKLAWALAHNVEPPASLLHDVLEAPAAERQSFARRAKLSASKCCKQHSAVPYDHAAPHDHAAHGHAPPSRSRPTTNLVIASAWRHCHGLAPTWSVLGAVTPPPEVVAWQFEWTLVSRVCPPSTLASSLTYPPPLPPPRA